MRRVRMILDWGRRCRRGERVWDIVYRRREYCRRFRREFELRRSRCIDCMIFGFC